MDCLLKNIPNGAKDGAQLIGEGIIALVASTAVFIITLLLIEKK